MSYEITSQLVHSPEELPGQPGVCFDPDNITLQGIYADELSAFRAKKLWTETLETNFLLDQDADFRVKVRRVTEQHVFVLSCEFLTACARYAFWRLTNNQAPEAQYIIETAHIPVCESRQEDILRAPDLRSVYDEPLVLGDSLDEVLIPRRRKSFYGWIRRLLGRRFY